MDIKTLRWQKTRRLVVEAGGISRFAERIDRTQQQANRFAGPNPVTGIGNKIARLIETSFNLDPNYLDRQEDKPGCNLNEPAINGVDAIFKADKSAADFVEARKIWLKTRPQAVYMVRSELREKLIDEGLEITSETDDGFTLSRHSQPLRLDLFIPFTGFNVYRYEGTYSMELPDFLVIPICRSTKVLDFYLIPKSILLEMPGNDAIRLDTANESVNGLSVAEYLNNLSSLA